MNYQPEILDEEEDDGTMPNSLETFKDLIVEHKIVKVENAQSVPYVNKWGRNEVLDGLALTLDNGKTVYVEDTDDCCARTTLETFLLHADKIDHVITGVGTTDGFTTWHVYADMGDVLEFEVAWTSGNPFYYGYGFDFVVLDLDGKRVEDSK